MRGGRKIIAFGGPETCAYAEEYVSRGNAKESLLAQAVNQEVYCISELSEKKNQM